MSSLTWFLLPVRSLQEGAGRRIGEQTEQLWSLIKPFCKRARYMTKAHWYDAMNGAFWALTLRKQRPAPAVLQGRRKHNDKQLGELREGVGACAAGVVAEILAMYPSPCPSCSPAEECRKAVAQLEVAARLQGVVNLEEAEATLLKHENDPGEKPDLDEQYVEVSEKVRQFRYVRKEGGALVAAAPGNVGIHLAGAANDESKLQKLINKQSALASKLGMGLKPWERDSSRYKAGLVKMCQRIIAQRQQVVQDQVMKRKLILQKLEHAESGKNANKLRKSAAAVAV